MTSVSGVAGHVPGDGFAGLNLPQTGVETRPVQQVVVVTVLDHDRGRSRRCGRRGGSSTGGGR